MIALGLEGACIETVPELTLFVANTPRERYEYAFRQVGLESTALGAHWIRAGESALQSALTLELPFREVGYFEANDGGSMAFRVALERGERFLVELDFDRSQPLVFIDLFRVVGDSLRPFRSMAHADSAATRLEYLVRRSGDYVIRVQPEILASGRYDLTVATTSSLEFPVSGHGVEAIRSGFGAPRDGGRREHHGVDIFAPRGTPVVAAAPSRVRSTRESGLGGRVVWLRTENGESLYYAHLDSVAVRRGMTVRAGDTVGFVGNTGNARTTPPHLHFGVYARGPTDPLPFIDKRPTSAVVVEADTAVVGQLVRVTRSRVSLVRSTLADDESPVQLEEGTVMRVLGGSADSYRVRLPDDAIGFIGRSSVELLVEPVEERVLGRSQPLHATPVEPTVTGSVIAGSTLRVFGRFNAHLFVETEEGKTGWIASLLEGSDLPAGEPIGGSVVAPRSRTRAQQ